MSFLWILPALAADLQGSTGIYTWGDWACARFHDGPDRCWRDAGPTVLRSELEAPEDGCVVTGPRTTRCAGEEQTWPEDVEQVGPTRRWDASQARSVCIRSRAGRAYCQGDRWRFPAGMPYDTPTDRPVRAPLLDDADVFFDWTQRLCRHRNDQRTCTLNGRSFEVAAFEVSADVQVAVYTRPDGSVHLHQLGRSKPLNVDRADGPYSIALAGQHACILETSGKVVCFGASPRADDGVGAPLFWGRPSEPFLASRCTRGDDAIRCGSHPIYPSTAPDPVLPGTTLRQAGLASCVLDGSTARCVGFVGTEERLVLPDDAVLHGVEELVVSLGRVAARTDVGVVELVNGRWTRRPALDPSLRIAAQGRVLCGELDVEVWQCDVDGAVSTVRHALDERLCRPSSTSCLVPDDPGLARDERWWVQR